MAYSYLVYVDKNSSDQAVRNYEIWNQYTSLFEMLSTSKGYLIRKNPDTVSIIFGNSIYGTQPDNQYLNIYIFTTLGTKGRVIAGGIKIVRDQPEDAVFAIIGNTISTPGRNEPTLDEVRFNAISQFFSVRRLVTEDDYKNFIFSVFRYALHVWPCLKRSDLRANEVTTFISFYDNTLSLVPTTSLTIDLDKNSVGFETILTPYSMSFDPGAIDAVAPPFEVLLFKSYSVITQNSTSYVLPFRMTYQKSPALTKIYYVPKIESGTITYITENTYTDETPTDPFLEIISVQFDKDTSQDSYTCTVQFDTNIGSIDASHYFLSVFGQNYTEVPINVSSSQVANKKFTFTVSAEYMDAYEDMKLRLVLSYKMTNDTYYEKQYDITCSLLKDVTDILGVFFNLVLVEDGVDTTYTLTLRNIPLIEQTYFDENFIGNNSFIADLLKDFKTSRVSMDNSKMFTDETKINFVRTSGTLMYHDFSDYYLTGTSNSNKEISSGEVTEITLPIDVHAVIKYEVGYNQSQVKENIVNAIQNLINVSGVFMNPIYRSKIIATIHGVAGVNHCELIKPEIDITYDKFDITEFTTEQLLDFVPEITYTDTPNLLIESE